MRKPNVVRIYKHSDGTLVTKGLEKVAYMLRDKTQFEQYGITTNLMNDLKALIDSFSNRLTDVEALGDQTNVTANKDAKAEELRTAIRDVMARVVLVFPFGTPKYKKFGTDTLSQQSDSELLLTAKRVVRVGTEFLPDLSENGLTAAMLTAITTLSEEFADLIVDMHIEIGNRDIEQEDRVEAGNTIYTILVKYTNTGQSIWETSDVAKFNDYVLYNTISGEAEEETPKAS
ncbi:MAG: hypothetical protein M0D53_11290 [Flavobacterium sp. JAD_PAG50586_2]|nr:MAG: hypothetical protein M0D53_11290 [Flavobacterium sp. JAD_PAG50586_2]